MMKAVKIGHSCLVLELPGHNILIDPGDYTEKQSELTGIDIILITHEHQDHLYMPSLKAVLGHNPGAKVFSNSTVGEILAAAKIKSEVVQTGDTVFLDSVSLHAVGQLHAPIHGSVPQVANTGFIINDRFYYPGDALTYPDKYVDVLALPVAGTWLKLSEALDFAVKVNPKACFPVHDGALRFFGGYHSVPAQYLPRFGIKFFTLENDPVLNLEKLPKK